MVRSIFFSLGLFVLLWGVSFLFVDKLVLNQSDDAARDPNFRGLFTTLNSDKRRVFDPPEWAAFSLMSAGSVTMLYSLALPRRKA